MAETFSQADGLIEKKQYEYAIFLLTDCINNTNDSKSAALMKRATCYMHLHRYQDAITDLEKAIELDRTLENAYVKLSKCYVAIGDFQNAINTMIFLEQIDKNNTFANCELQNLNKLKELNKNADQFFEEKKYQDVVRIMDECLTQSKHCVKFKLIKAECLVYLGQYENALDTVNEIIFTNEDDLEALCIRALNLMHQEKYHLGLAELRDIISVSPRAKTMYRSYRQMIESLKQANTEFENNNLIDAERLYRHVLHLNIRNEHKNKQVYLKLAQICFKQNEYVKCIEMTCDILEDDPKNIKALEFRAKCNFEIEDYDMALEDYRAILSLTTSENKEILKNIKITEEMAKTNNDNYKILNISKNSITVPIIKTAYRKLAKKYHPDKAETQLSKYSKHKLNAKFTKINKAYKELMGIYDDS